MKRILVTTDLSIRSDRAIERAAQLAEQHGAKLIVLHVIDEDLPVTVATRMRDAAKETLAAVLASQHVPDSAEIMIETGDPVQTITEKADVIDADLVVLGVHKPRPFWDMFSGTTMERIVRALTRPALLVTSPVAGPYASVLCGIDLSPSCLAAAQTARTLAPDAQITSFHAIHVPYRGMIARDASEKQLAPFVKDASSRLEDWWNTSEIPEGMQKPVLSVGSLHTVFQAALDRSHADLFALGAHGRTPLSPSLLGGFTEEHLRNPVMDVLVVRG